MSSRHPEPLPGASGHTDYRRQSPKGQSRPADSIRVTEPSPPTVARVLEVIAVLTFILAGVLAFTASGSGMSGSEIVFTLSVLIGSAISLFAWSAIIKATASTAHYAKITAHLLASRDK